MKPFLSEEEIQACPPAIERGRVMVKEGDYVVRNYRHAIIPRGTVFQIESIVGTDAYMRRLEGDTARRPCLFLDRFAICQPEPEHEPL